MSSMTDHPMKEGLLALAERCEKATGPDRELDCRLAAAAHRSMAGKFRIVGPPTYATDRYFSGQKGIDWIGYDLLNCAPAYTASLDAALTLVPEGYDWLIGRTNGGLTIHAEVGGRGDEFMRFGATPALALVAAALKARASQVEDE